MSSGVFRGKEFSNRIKLSQLVQDLLAVSDLGSLQPWGGRWVWGHLGHGEYPQTCTHMHAHMHTHKMLKSTCSKIANGHQHGSSHVYHV